MGRIETRKRIRWPSTARCIKPSWAVSLSNLSTPTARLSYNNVIWLVPLFMLIIMVRDMKKLLNFPLIFLLVGFSANYLYNLFPRSILIADYSILIYFVWMLFVMMIVPKTKFGN